MEGGQSPWAWALIYLNRNLRPKRQPCQICLKTSRQNSELDTYVSRILGQ